MKNTPERRREQRLRYHWPVWFAEDFNDTLHQGQMVDISSEGAAFTCRADHSCPWPGQWLTTRFAVPRCAPHDEFDMADFIRSGHVRRIDYISDSLRRIAIQFAEPLPFKPAEQHDTHTSPLPHLHEQPQPMAVC